MHVCFYTCLYLTYFLSYPNEIFYGFLMWHKLFLFRALIPIVHYNDLPFPFIPKYAYCASSRPSLQELWQAVSLVGYETRLLDQIIREKMDN